MLSEEALVLIVVVAVVVLIVLGVLELIWPTRPRHPRRRAASNRDGWRRGRPAARPAPRTRLSTPAAGGRPPATGGATRAAAREPIAARPSPPEPDVEPPIERLLLSQAAAAPPRSPAWPRPPQAERAAAPAPPKPGMPPAELDVRSGPAPRVVESGSAPPAPPAVQPPPAPPVVERPSAPPTPPAVQRPSPSAPPAPPVVQRPSPSAPPAPPVTQPSRTPSSASPAPATTPLRAPESPVERCWALYEARQFDDVVREGTSALEKISSGTLALPHEERARLLGVVGLARQAMSDHDGARAAFEQAIAVAPEPARLTWQRHLAGLALQAGQQLLARAENGGVLESEEGMNVTETAIAWFAAGLAATPDDAALQDARTAARSALWTTCERVVGGLIQRQEYHGARRILRQALSDDECPDALRATFRDLLSTTFSGEVGQLTAEAIRRMQDGREDEALATLDRAESILATIPAEGLPELRRQELERRLWWSYTKLGIRRVDSGHDEEAVGPLLHALSFQSVGGDRQEETRGPLLRALERVVDTRSSLIERMTAEGDREGATRLCERLRRSLREAVDRGLPRERLAGPLARTDALAEKLGNSAR